MGSHPASRGKVQRARRSAKAICRSFRFIEALEGRMLLSAGAVLGTVWDDANADGVRQAGEGGLAGYTVYADQNGNGVFDQGSSKTTSASYACAPIGSSNPALPDAATTQFPLSVSGASGVLVDVNVTLDLAHSRCEDLDVFLISPAGTRVELFTDVGGASANFDYTTLDDQSPISITSGSGSFSSTYRPEGSLATLNGESGNGMWNLEVTDDTAGVFGRFGLFSLTLTYGDPVGQSDGNGDYVIGGVPAGTFTIRQASQPVSTFSSPASGAQTVTVVAGQVVSGIDFGNAPRAAIKGHVWNDANGEGAHEPTENGAAGFQVFADEDADTAWDQTTTTASATTAVPIPAIGTTTSSIAVNGLGGVMGDLNVQVNIQHSNGSDLSAYLIGPTGLRVKLFSHLSSSFTSMQVTFDDEAAKLIEAYWLAGSYQPDGALYSFDSYDPNGTWTLEVVDDVASYGGTIQSWSLVMTTGELGAVSGADGSYALIGLQPGTHTIRQVSKTAWNQTAPAGAIHTVAITDRQVVPSIDFADQGLPGGVSGSTGTASPGWTVFLDTNNNGKLDAGETSTVSDATGHYSFSGLTSGYYNIEEIIAPGWQQINYFERAYSIAQVYKQTGIGQPTGQWWDGLQITQLAPETGPYGPPPGYAPLSGPVPAMPGSVDGAQGAALSPTTLFYIDGSSPSGNVLYELDLDTFAVIDSDPVPASSPIGGLAYLNGLVYMLQDQADTILVWNPTTDQIVNLFIINADLAGGFTGAADRGMLYVTSPPLTSSGLPFDQTWVLAIDPATGQVVDQFHPWPKNMSTWFLPGIQDLMYYQGGLWFEAPGWSFFYYDLQTRLASRTNSPFFPTSPSQPPVGSTALAADGAARGQRVLVRSDLSPVVNFANTAVSAAPGMPDLDPLSDLGFSAVDNVTSLDNSSASKVLKCQVDGTVPGTTVTLYAKKTDSNTTYSAGSAIATGTSTLITTNGALDFTDGQWDLFAYQKESGKAASESPSITLTVDTVGPTVSGISRVSSDGTSITVEFSEPVYGLSDAQVTISRNGVPVSLAGATFTTTDHIHWTIGNMGGIFRQGGQYHLTVGASAPGVTDLAGNPLTGSLSSDWMAACGSDGPDTIRILKNVAPGSVDVVVNGVSSTLAVPGSQELRVLALDGADRVIIDLSNGYPLLTGGMHIDGGGGGTTLEFRGGTSAESLTLFGGYTLDLGGYTDWSGVNAIEVDLGGGGDSLALYKFTTATLTATQHLASLSIQQGSHLDLAGGPDKVLVTDSFVISADGKLNLKDNDLLVRVGDMAAIRSAIASGQILTDSTTATVPGRSTTLGYAAGDDPAIAWMNSTFNGESFGLAAVVVKYTYLADANLDGSVDGSDVALWAQNFSGALGPDPANPRHWTQGDWNRDGSVDGSDVALWAQNFTGALGGGGLTADITEAPPSTDLAASSADPVRSSTVIPGSVPVTDRASVPRSQRLHSPVLLQRPSLGTSLIPASGIMQKPIESPGRLQDLFNKQRTILGAEVELLD